MPIATDARLDRLGRSVYHQHMLVIDAARVFWGGLGLLLAATVADSLIHAAGWVNAERPVHWSLLVGMVIALGGVFLRAARTTRDRKESVHAHR